MSLYNVAILFIGLVFNVLIILFVVISVLLIYSLLMITTETKTFDFGVMRLVGLSSKGFVAMIFTQAVMFVIPSIICAYICSFPCLWGILSKLNASYGQKQDRRSLSASPNKPFLGSEGLQSNSTAS